MGASVAMQKGAAALLAELASQTLHGLGKKIRGKSGCEVGWVSRTQQRPMKMVYQCISYLIIGRYFHKYRIGSHLNVEYLM